MTKSLNKLTIKEARKGLDGKDFSSLELTKSCLKRISAVDNKIKAFIKIEEQKAIQAAKKADSLIAKGIKKPLLGVPCSVKDIFSTKDMETTAASRVLEDYQPVYESTVTRKLRESGAVFLGKTNLDAWCHGSSTEASDFFTTLNPWNIKKLPGGSSGGSAASVAADESIFSVGTETAGSIRLPASWCGVTGLKPSYGRVSRYGVIAMGSSLDSPGPLTKTVEDAAMILEVIAGKDENDSTTLIEEIPDYLKSVNKNKIDGLKIGVPDSLFLADADQKVNEKILESIKIFKNLGAKIIKIDLIDPEYSVAIFTIIQRSEVSSNLARYSGERYGNDRDSFGDEAKKRVMLGTYTLSSGYYDQYYKKAQKLRTVVIDDFRKAFKKVDVIVGPTTPTTALEVGARRKNEAMFGELMDILSVPSAMAGITALSVPCGIVGKMPAGMQIIGPALSEELVLKIGHAFQKVTDWHLKRPRI